MIHQMLSSVCEYEHLKVAFVSHRGCIGDMVKDTRDKSCNIHHISKGQLFFLNIRFGELLHSVRLQHLQRSESQLCRIVELWVFLSIKIIQAIT